MTILLIGVLIIGCVVLLEMRNERRSGRVEEWMRSMMKELRELENEEDREIRDNLDI